MALTDSDWSAIYGAIERMVPPNEVTYGKVIKRDERKKLVWLKEYGEQPIPLVGFNGMVTIHDETPTGVKIKKVTIEPQVPKLGELVVVLRQMGARRLPKCVGVVLSKGYIA